MDMNENSLDLKVDLERSEKTVLVDALNWYVDYTKDSMFTEELSEEMKNDLDKIIKKLDDESVCHFNDEIGSLITEEVLSEFGQALKEQISSPEVENKEKTGNFYRIQFEGIAEKIKEEKKTQNPFF